MLENGKNKLISNVTANEIKDPNELKNLLIKQIENMRKINNIMS